MAFNGEKSARALKGYLADRPPFNEVFLTLLSNRVEGVDFAPIEHWHRLLQRARRRGEFLGVDARAFPRDLWSFWRCHTALQARILERYPPVPPLTLDEVVQLVATPAAERFFSGTYSRLRMLPLLA